MYRKYTTVITALFFVFILLIIFVSMYVFVFICSILYISYNDTGYVCETALYKNSEIIKVMMVYTSYYTMIPAQNHVKQPLYTMKLRLFMVALWSIYLVKMHVLLG